MTLTLTLPFPPSVNRAWRSLGRGRVVLSERALSYRRDVAWRLVAARASQGMPRDPLMGRLAVSVLVMAPDRRDRDLDNLGKVLLDALTHAGVWGDDSQIDDWRVIRGEIGKPGRVQITIENRPGLPGDGCVFATNDDIKGI